MSRVQEIISNIKSKRVFIQTHNFPDPDAIASAVGLQYLLKYNGLDSIICYKGKIDRYATKKMVQLLDIDIMNADDYPESMEGEEIILIDAQKNSGNTYDLPGEEIISIDHHPICEKYNYIYSDIRDGVGACASIITSYFIEEGIDIPGNIATALLYGIKVDTAQMSRGVGQLDLDMFNHLFFKSDMEKISYLENSTFELVDLKSYLKAIETISIENDVCVANTGEDCPEALIAQIADFLTALKEVRCTVVYSKRRGGIKISVRCESNTGCNAGIIAMEALDGIGTGGGHQTMAGGFVAFKSDMQQSEEELLIEIEERFRKIFAKYIREDEFGGE